MHYSKDLVGWNVKVENVSLASFVCHLPGKETIVAINANLPDQSNQAFNETHPLYNTMFSIVNVPRLQWVVRRIDGFGPE
jgi:hypothetical protein